jgi:replicative DNA helicase
VREPPKNLDAERTVLGSCLIDNSCIDVVMGILATACFYATAHQVIFGAVLDLHQKRAPVDIVSVAVLLNEQGQLDAVGGAAYMAAFELHVLTTQNVAHYANIVLEKWKQREEIQLAHEEIEANHEPDSDKRSEMRAEIRKRRQALEETSDRAAQEGPVAVADSIMDTIQEVRDRAEGKAPGGLETGFPLLDHLTAGFFPGDMILLTGQTSSGKTAMADNLIRRWCQGGLGGMLFSLEMIERARHLRLVCLLTGIPFRALRRATKLDASHWASIDWAMNEIKRWPLYIDDTRGLTDVMLKSRVRQVAQEIDLNYVVVDYAQLVEMEGATRTMNREQMVSQIGRSIGQVAAEHGIPVIALAQLNKDGDTRESAALGQHCDIHIKSGLYIDPAETAMKPGDPPKPCDVIIEKGRNVGKGVIHFLFHGARMEFQEAPR